MVILATFIEIVSPSEANAQRASTSITKQAQKLLNDAYERCDKGDITGGRAAIDEVLRLVPSSPGALFAQGYCSETQGAFAAAWDQYKVAERAAIAAKRADVRDAARERMTALAPRLAWLTIVVSPSAGEVSDLQVTLDGAIVEKASWGAPRALEKGRHEVVATASGRSPFKETVDATGDNSNTEVSINTLSELIAPAPPAAPKPRVIDATRAPPAPIPPSPLKVAGVVTSVVGVLSLGAAAAAGGLALAKKRQSDGHCVGNQCDDAGTGARLGALTAGDVSTGFFFAGSALVLGGASLYFIGAKSREAGVNVSLGVGVVQVHGSF